VAFKPIRGYRDVDRYPSTEHQLRHIYRNVDTNGLGDAFRRVSNRILVDPDRLQELIAAPGKSNAPAATGARAGA